MDSRQLHYFRTVVDQRSFTRAADVLHMTQPSLSLSVRRLEKDLGVQLLTRTSSGVEPTEAGRYLYSVASQIGQEMEQARVHLHDIASGAVGRVRLSVAPEFNWGFLPDILLRLRREAPDVELTVIDPAPAETLANVQEGRSDLGLMITSDVSDLQRRYGDTLVVETVATLPLQLALPERLSHLPSPVNIADLREETLIIPFAHPSFIGLPEILEVYWAAHPEFRPYRIQKVSTLQTAVPLVSGGVGVAYVTGVAQSFTTTRVHYRDIPDPPPPLHTALLHRRDAFLSPAAERLRALLLDCVPGQGR
ncbi:MAG: LysR family transcriptional regulator [Corynebacterium humireducens]|jgi:DNA-binding transcriptional LysR family regulator|uniref:LysR family transcriptional regulator n=1 Tax=Corynebacterium humireducens TaxID=1223514 RepID=A0A7X6SWK8_9CORY|nr:LysR family transcriptional regulator [Corynebacterium humireducens]